MFVAIINVDNGELNFLKKKLYCFSLLLFESSSDHSNVNLFFFPHFVKHLTFDLSLFMTLAC